jgi:hypothetical protein
VASIAATSVPELEGVALLLSVDVAGAVVGAAVSALAVAVGALAGSLLLVVVGYAPPFDASSFELSLEHAQRPAAAEMTVAKTRCFFMVVTLFKWESRRPNFWQPQIYDPLRNGEFRAKYVSDHPIVGWRRGFFQASGSRCANTSSGYWCAAPADFAERGAWGAVH